MRYGYPYLGGTVYPLSPETKKRYDKGMKKQNAKGFGARPSAVAYYVVVPTSVPGRTLEVGPIASRAVANNYAKVVSASPDFAGLAIGVKEVTV